MNPRSSPRIRRVESVLYATSALLHHFRYLLWPSAVRPQAASPGITPEFDLFWTPGDTLGFLLTFLHEENLTQFPRTVSNSVRRVETPHDWLNLRLRVVFFHTFNSKSISYSCITCWSFIKVHSVKFRRTERWNGKRVSSCIWHSNYSSIDTWKHKG